MAKKDLDPEENKGKDVKDAKGGKDVKKKDKDKKPNIFVRMGRRLKETFSELKRVTWPTLPKALKSTGVVIVIVLIFLVIVTAVNIGFTYFLEFLTGLGG